MPNAAHCMRKLKLIRSVLNGQRGGVAVLTSLGFMLFSVPLITGSLGLAQSTTVDSRVKNDILRQSYCGLAVPEYIDYLVVDASRWDGWLADNADAGNPGTACNGSLRFIGSPLPMMGLIVPTGPTRRRFTRAPPPTSALSIMNSENVLT